MATKIDTVVRHYADRLPIADTPSNQPYQGFDGKSDGPGDPGRRKQGRKEFLHDAYPPWPDIDFPNLQPDMMAAYRSMLLGLIEDLEDAPEDTDKKSVDMVYEALNSKLTEVERHLVVARRIGEGVVADWYGDAGSEELRHRAAEMSIERFGPPSAPRFNWFLAKYQAIAGQKATDANPVVRQKAHELLAKTAPVAAYEMDAPLELNEATRIQFKNDLYEIFPGLEDFCNQTFPDEIPPSEAVEYFDEMRDMLGLPADRYHSKLSPGRACEEQPWGVAVGGDRAAYSGKSIIRLSFHEWVHVLRRHNAKNQDEPARRLPTKSNLSFEEAFCVQSERALVDQPYVSGEKHYLSIGLMMGLDKTQQTERIAPDDMRSFRETMEIIGLMNGLVSGAADLAGFEKARGTAYSSTLRGSRGNALDARDLSYHKGDEPAKRAILATKDMPDSFRRDMIRWYLSAQFDPTDPADAENFPYHPHAAKVEK